MPFRFRSHSSLWLICLGLWVGVPTPGLQSRLLLHVHLHLDCCWCIVYSAQTKTKMQPWTGPDIRVRVRETRGEEELRSVAVYLVAGSEAKFYGFIENWTHLSCCKRGKDAGLGCICPPACLRKRLVWKTNRRTPPGGAASPTRQERNWPKRVHRWVLNTKWYTFVYCSSQTAPVFGKLATATRSLHIAFCLFGFWFGLPQVFGVLFMETRAVNNSSNIETEKLKHENMIKIGYCWIECNTI